MCFEWHILLIILHIFLNYRFLPVYDIKHMVSYAEKPSKMQY